MRVMTFVRKQKRLSVQLDSFRAQCHARELVIAIADAVKRVTRESHEADAARGSALPIEMQVSPLLVFPHLYVLTCMSSLVCPLRVCPHLYVLTCMSSLVCPLRVCPHLPALTWLLPLLAPMPT